MQKLTSEQWYEILGYETEEAEKISDIRISKTIADSFARAILPRLREYYTEENEDTAEI